jgi:hypothetical protein
MQLSDRQPTEVHELLEIQDREELRRTAHKIAWARMNGSIDVANPFVEIDPNRFTLGDGQYEDSLSRHL